MPEKRLIQQVEDMKPWPQQKAELLVSHKSLLDYIGTPGIKLLEFVAFTFSFVQPISFFATQTRCCRCILYGIYAMGSFVRIVF